MSDAAYEALPTLDDANANYPPPSSHSRSHSKTTLTSPSRKLLLFVAVLCLVALGSYKAGQWSVLKHSAVSKGVQTPEELEQEDKVEVPLNETDTMSHAPYSVGYFTNWGIYGRKYPPSSIPVKDLTHVLYAFADIKPDGTVASSDAWADEQIHYAGDTWDEPGTNLYGNFKALYKLKKQNRHFKVILSIGGWTYSPKMHPVVVDPALRKRFVESAIEMLENYGLDGLDVDYEYPTNEQQAKGYVDLLKELRQGLDSHASKKGAGCKFLLTIAAPCGPDNYKKLLIGDMNHYLDFWNLMAYDFSGSWDKIANNQANIFGGPVSASEAIDYYVSQGVPHQKLILGMPLYGRSFLNTEGPGTPFSGVGQGSWEQGIYDYRALPLPGAHMFQDEKALASWSYDSGKKEMVSFDSEEVGTWKAQWIKKVGLGGAMYWELSGDKGGPREGMEGGPGKDLQPGKSLVSTVNQALGGLDQSENWLRYEGSKFDNIRKEMA